MADEFAKGFGIFVSAGLIWMTLAGWYNTPAFEGKQLTGADPALSAMTIYDQAAIILKDAMFWFMIIGALTFWVVLPAVEQARSAIAGE